MHSYPCLQTLNPQPSPTSEQVTNRKLLGHNLCQTWHPVTILVTNLAPPYRSWVRSENTGTTKVGRDWPRVKPVAGVHNSETECVTDLPNHCLRWTSQAGKKMRFPRWKFSSFAVLQPDTCSNFRLDQRDIYASSWGEGSRIALVNHNTSSNVPSVQERALKVARNCPCWGKHF